MGNKHVNIKENKEKIVYSNGEVYEGEIIEQNIRHGYGIYYYNNGDRYEGMFYNNLRHGTGVLFKNNGEIYDGWWQNDFMEGVGTFYHNNGDRYYGEWKEGKKQGKGFIYSDDGSKFVGEFKNNKKFGKGEFTCGKTRNNYYQNWNNGMLIKQIEKYKMDNMDYVDFREIDSSSFEKNLEIKNNQHSHQFKSDFKNKYIGLELAKYINSKNPERFYDSMQIIRKNNSLFLYKPDIYLWDSEEVYLWLKQLSIKVPLELIKNKHINGETLITYDFLNLIQALEIYVEKDIDILKKSIDLLKTFPKKKSSKMLINMKRKENEEIDHTRYSYQKVLEIIENKELNSEDNKQNFEEIGKKELDKTHIIQKHDNLKIIFEEDKSDKNIMKDLEFSRKIKENHILTEDNLNKELEKDNRLNSHQRENNIDEFNSNSNLVNKIVLNLRTMTLNGLNFYINYNELRLSNKIGEGGFGEVYLGNWNGENVAVKKLTLKQTSKDRTVLLKFINEINIISSLRHPNIVLYMGASIEKNNYYMITEYLPKGSLFDFIHREKKKFTENEQLHIAYEIAIGLQYLHSRNIIHCDLKSSNILLDDQLKIKIGDFGLSRFLNKKNPYENLGRIGTPHWMAPEILKGGNYQISADIFSYGMILWEILTQEIPYYGIDPRKLINIVAEDKKIVAIPNKGNESLKKLTQDCLNYYPDKRPLLRDVVDYLDMFKKNTLEDVNTEELYKYLY